MVDTLKHDQLLGSSEADNSRTKKAKSRYDSADAKKLASEERRRQSHLASNRERSKARKRILEVDEQAAGATSTGASQALLRIGLNKEIEVSRSVC